MRESCRNSCGLDSRSGQTVAPCPGRSYRRELTRWRLALVLLTAAVVLGCAHAGAVGDVVSDTAPARRVAAENGSVRHQPRDVARTAGHADETPALRQVATVSDTGVSRRDALSHRGVRHHGSRRPTLRVLFLRNSLTAANDLPRIVAPSTRKPDASTSSRDGRPGGVNLEDHWRFTGGREAIARGGWDGAAPDDARHRQHADHDLREDRAADAAGRRGSAPLGALRRLPELDAVALRVDDPAEATVLVVVALADDLDAL